MRVTVGLPFYNAASTLADAIRSVLAQSFQDWELILVDDGSTDDSRAITMSVRDPRVTLISDGVNRQLSRRLNQIAKLARGELIARMDADDMMHPDRLRRQVEFLDEHRGVDVVGTGIYTINDRDEPTGIGTRFGAFNPTPRGALTSALLVHATVMGRREWFRANPYDDSYPRSEDRELWCRTFLKGETEFAKIDDPLYFVREEGSVTLEKFMESYRTTRRIYRRYGPALVGWPNTIGEIAKSHAKSTLHRVFAIFGQQMALVRNRRRSLDRDEHVEAVEQLAAIKRQPLDIEDVYDSIHALAPAA